MLQKFSVNVQCILNVLHQLVVSNLIYLTLNFKIDNSDYTLSSLNGPLLSFVVCSFPTPHSAVAMGAEILACAAPPPSGCVSQSALLLLWKCLPINLAVLLLPKHL